MGEVLTGLMLLDHKKQFSFSQFFIIFVEFNYECLNIPMNFKITDVIVEQKYCCSLMPLIYHFIYLLRTIYHNS